MQFVDFSADMRVCILDCLGTHDLMALKPLSKDFSTWIDRALHRATFVALPWHHKQYNDVDLKLAVNYFKLCPRATCCRVMYEHDYCGTLIAFSLLTFICCVVRHCVAVFAYDSDWLQGDSVTRIANEL